MDSQNGSSNASGSQSRNPRPFSHQIADLHVRRDPDDSFDLQDGSLSLQDERLNSLNLNLQDVDSLNLPEGTLGSLHLHDGTLDSLNLPEGHSLSGRHSLHANSVNALNVQRESLDQQVRDLFFTCFFLDATTHLYKRVCLSVCPSVNMSVSILEKPAGRIMLPAPACISDLGRWYRKPMSFTINAFLFSDNARSRNDGSLHELHAYSPQCGPV